MGKTGKTGKSEKPGKTEKSGRDAYPCRYVVSDIEWDTSDERGPIDASELPGEVLVLSDDPMDTDDIADRLADTFAFAVKSLAVDEVPDADEGDYDCVTKVPGENRARDWPEKAADSDGWHNRTTHVVIGHDTRRELVDGAAGIPRIGMEELTFAGRTLAAKWLLGPGRRRVRKGDEVYLRFYGDRWFGNDLEQELGPLARIEKSGVFPADFAASLTEILRSKKEVAADAAYLAPYAVDAWNAKNAKNAGNTGKAAKGGVR